MEGVRGRKDFEVLTHHSTELVRDGKKKDSLTLSFYALALFSSFDRMRKKKDSSLL